MRRASTQLDLHVARVAACRLRRWLQAGQGRPPGQANAQRCTCCVHVERHHSGPRGHHEDLTLCLLAAARPAEGIAHHAALFFLYMRALVDLEQLFGDLIPDSDFVISTVDRPMLMAYEDSKDAPQVRLMAGTVK